ncbi:hypothetical protein CPB85DRAFT_1447792 [Mucidula mucida]|nr:hypothetical protein CPB85DRAFT_1447792 [Mucidula mucida]
MVSVPHAQSCPSCDQTRKTHRGLKDDPRAYFLPDETYLRHSSCLRIIFAIDGDMDLAKFASRTRESTRLEKRYADL